MIQWNTRCDGLTLTDLLAGVALLMVLVACCALAQGVDFDGKTYPRRGWDDPLEAEYITTVTRQVQTPHLPTAVPYSQGATRVLFICPRFSARPTVELCQRFDIEERHALVPRSRSLAEIGRQLGIDETVGTPLVVRNGRYVGACERPICQGDGKWLRLEEHLAGDDISWEQSYAYADTYWDLPLLDKVGHPVAVYPDAQLAAHARERGWETIEEA